MILTRSQILESRKKWAEFLIEPERKKAMGALDNGNGNRCCLGHGCFILDIERHKIISVMYGADKNTALAPREFINMVGLWNNVGATENRSPIKHFESFNINNTVLDSLANVNDGTKATPQGIGRYLLTVLEGGEDTPFRPLTDYPE